MVGLAIAESGFPAWCSTTYNKISDDKTLIKKKKKKISDDKT